MDYGELELSHDGVARGWRAVHTVARRLVAVQVREYYRLTKPGIIYGNLLTAAAGFIFASGRHIDSSLFLATLTGTSLIIAGAGVYNNLMDRQLDARMARTAQRALVTGAISVRAAVIYASLLTLVGFALLIELTNWSVVVIGLVGLLDYLVAYGWSKRHSSTSTLVGSISGATPILAGYVAVSGRLDSSAWLLFGLMIVWQMPHFYAIALFRAKDYQSVGLPLMPLRRSLATAVWRMRAYVALYGALVILMATVGNAGNIFLIIMLLLTVWWLNTSRHQPVDSAAAIIWGRRLFGGSLYVVLGLSLTLMAAPWLP